MPQPHITVFQLLSHTPYMKRKRILLALAPSLICSMGLTSMSSTLTVLHHFEPGDGELINSLVLGKDGNLYGTAAIGGQGDCWNCGYGTVFRVAPDGTFTVLYQFSGSDGSMPGTSEGYFDSGGGFLQAADGSLYGVTHAGGAGFVDNEPQWGEGTIFKMTADGLLTTLVYFDGTNGGAPNSLLQAKDGNFYGTTGSGGPSGSGQAGTVFRMTPDGTLTTIGVFDGTNGSGPRSLIQGQDGNFYGTTDHGGARGHGTVFKMTLEGPVSTLAAISDTNASGPYFLMQASDGNFYGTVCYGGKNINRNGYYNFAGMIFRVTPNGVLTNLVLFNMSNGGCPVAALTEGTDGNCYGSTWEGGPVAQSEPFGLGTLFKMTSQGQITTLTQFNLRNGLNPSASLVQANDGSFYGTTSLGGTNDTLGIGYGPGVVFHLSVPEADAPKIISGGRTGNVVIVNWLALIGRSYQLQFTTDLTFTNWDNVGSIITATNALVTASDYAGADPQRFYRVTLLP
jgi:uncharacterized repeat protein (TIGR03803 family)